MGKDKADALKAFLARLPGKIAAPLATAIEADRLVNPAGLPHETILDGLRPVLRGAETRPHRLRTPLRVFCEPFEDLLVGDHEGAKVEGRIARSSLRPVWRLVQDVAGKPFAARTASLTGALLGRTEAELAEIVPLFQAEAAAALATALEAGSAPALADPDLCADAEEIRRLLAIAPLTLSLRTRFIRPVPTLEDADLDIIRACYEDVGSVHPDAARYVPVIVLGRLARPWEILRVLAKLARSQSDTLVSQTDVGLVGELLLHDLERLAERIEAAEPASFDPETLGTAISQFARLGHGLTTELDIHRHGPWGERLAELRARVGTRMERFLDQSVRDVTGLLAVRRPGNPRRRHERQADLGRPLDDARAGRARAVVQLVTSCRGVAAQAAFNVAHATCVERISESLDDYVPAILEALKGADEELLPIAQAYFGAAVELIGLLRGEAEADLLRRKGAIARAG
ncbi:MAG: hypothetical protein HXY25_09590 [Alphaproteobacteria bacterium]|nr:hypothetical protein [Alphaproteobacteria bacterium]